MQFPQFSYKTGRVAGTARDRTLYEETWSLASGDKTLAVLKGPDAVAVFVDDPDNSQFALVVQPRPAVGDPAVQEIVAGKRDVPGETALQTAIRELGEEAGLYASSWTVLAQELAMSPGHDSERLTLYVARGPFSRTPTRPQDAHIQLQWYSYGELDKLIDAARTPRLTDGKTLIALLMLKLELVGASTWP